jgi:hypothetical protein
MNPKETRKEMKGMPEVRNWLHHHLNSLHIYCRLVRVMPGWLARKIVLYWESTAIYGVLYTST